MAVFDESPEEWQRLDWRILVNGSINLYFSQEILNESIDWFLQNKYTMFTFDCSKWLLEEEFHKEIKEGLSFPDYYGENLNAFNDCLRGLDVPYEGGTIIVFQRYDLFYKRFPHIAHDIVDIIETNSRRFLLTGRRLITLVQSDDPSISLNSVGACPVMWNGKEWLKQNRGL